ncbi:MAG: 50S ribosomal protein L11 methyltransferase [Candidatus Moranbacteria bacterium]|nr:50S ribosomal protein L11 methyltransferase [Candidatus Moranbacteria bacterium]
MVNKKIFKIQKYKIEIEGDPLVFFPSPHGTKGIGENIKVFKSDSVLDIGTGTGILAILAAKMGGNVYAIDILDDSIKCAKKNALLNGVNIKFVKSDLFKNINNKKFDVIIANVPQELISPKIIKKLKSEIITGMDGRDNGSEVLFRTLKNAKKFMTVKTRFYVAVYSLSGWRNNLRYILENYNAKLVDFYSGEVKKFVYDDLDYYKDKKEIGIYLNKRKYWGDIFVFELSLK